LYGSSDDMMFISEQMVDLDEQHISTEISDEDIEAYLNLTLEQMTVVKQFYLIALMLLLAATTTVAQESRAERFERIEAAKIAFITNELNLTPAEAQDFFPVYNQYYEEISKLRQERRSVRRLRNNTQSEHQKIPKNSFNFS